MILKEEGLEINEQFYAAFNQRDMRLMQKTWHQDASATCLHPGWNMLRGFDPIMQSWAEIFQHSANLEIKLSHVDVFSSDEMIWVSCQENLFSLMSAGVQVSKVHATNLFKRVNGQWKMALHHASAVPGLTGGSADSAA